MASLTIRMRFMGMKSLRCFPDFFGTTVAFFVDGSTTLAICCFLIAVGAVAFLVAPLVAVCLEVTLDLPTLCLDTDFAEELLFDPTASLEPDLLGDAFFEDVAPLFSAFSTPVCLDAVFLEPICFFEVRIDVDFGVDAFLPATVFFEVALLVLAAFLTDAFSDIAFLAPVCFFVVDCLERDLEVEAFLVVVVLFEALLVPVIFLDPTFLVPIVFFKAEPLAPVVFFNVLCLRDAFDDVDFFFVALAFGRALLKLAGAAAAAASA